MRPVPWTQAAGEGRDQRGLTIMELMIASTVTATLMLSGVIFFRGTAGSMGESVEVARVQNAASAGLEAFLKELKLTQREHIWIDETDPVADAVVLQVPVAFGSAGPTWGATTPRAVEDGGEMKVRHPGWRIRYRVAGGRLLREVLDGEGVLQGDPLVVAAHLVGPVASCNGGVIGLLQAKAFHVWREHPTTLPRFFSVAVKTMSRPANEASSNLSRLKVNINKTTVRVH